ncbi:MAG TPA: glycosyltransferase family 4 protein [Pseudonocardiaceae bacterium]|jgi:glycosyltransferase involved in cell wall biosynthesis|nr:glycosyltransferase family 4 protein [Pseudonocardiaceae bacterium]
MRIIQVAPTPFGREGLFGGGERYPLELARALAREVSCELVTFGASPQLVVEPSGLRVRVLPTLLHLRRHPAHPVAWGLPAALHGASLVHTHHLRSAPSRMAAVTARITGQRLAVTDHGLGGGGWAGLLPRLFDHFLTVSRHSALTLRAPPARTTVIYGGADPVRFYPDPTEQRRGVLFVGRLTPHKGVDRLIRALPAGAGLTCVGTGGHDPHPPESGYGQLLRRLASGRMVTFAGEVADHELPVLYRRAQVVVLPSVHRTCYGREVAISELLGLTVLEAMASGTPVVCSRLGGLPEVVEDGTTGFLVTPGDVDELHDRIATLLTDAGLAARMGGRARELVLDRFTWQACAARCLAVYDDLLRA